MAVLWVLVSVALLVWWVDDISHSIQIGNLIVKIERSLYRAIDAEERAMVELPIAMGDLPSPVAGAGPVLSRVGGYLRKVDHRRLLHAAEASGTVVSLENSRATWSSPVSRWRQSPCPGRPRRPRPRSAPL